MESQYAKGREPFADGVAETWWDDRDAMKAHRGTDALADLLADELQFMDPDSRSTIMAEEVVIANGAIPAGGGVKIITRLRRRPTSPSPTPRRTGARRTRRSPWGCRGWLATCRTTPGPAAPSTR
jgi:hypothetical protein